MDLLDNLALGFSEALAVHNVLFCLLGVALGTAVGVLPGIGPTASIALLLPLTFGFDDPVSAIIMLAGIYYGAQYGGSTTAILLNIPGESSSAVTAIDGHPMARQGRAGVALAAAALGSFFAGIVGTFVLAAAAGPLAAAALTFGSAEMFAVVVLGLVASIALASGSALKALAMIVLGILLGTIGQDLYTAVPRFTFGVRELWDGLSFVSVAVAVFGIAEILKNLHDPRTRVRVAAKVENLWPTREDRRRMVGPVLRATGLGSVLGVLPGGGHVLAAYGAYAVEKRVSRRPQEFGRGAIEGVTGPESANNAAAQTSFVPLLALGLPAHPVMALLLSALIIQGIQPGPGVMTAQPELVWGLIASMFIGNLLLVVLNLPLIRMWVKLLDVPYSVMFPAIIAFACIGTYAIDQNPFHVLVMAVLGVGGFVLVRCGCEPAPLLLGFVLGPLLENHLRRALLISHGDPTVFVTRPISGVLLGLAVVALVIAVLPMIRRKRDVVFAEED
ncbi:tripartite tricarboxylate transporter permease [Promicromonospora thailandica]|uniref:TctA family transporter n=1 Tax=Promicromonospora thailandica TaxID=765201 RepID=A0A9X2G9B5_9MICO|nr:tripartite tricarboxylate transporter permease [Promicromonospora thailandica]MCP2264351.1 TctA family transporter [Promicromonospora thailandica]BFF20958.1 tripartite tricarboxylate transporter permease [Promicromonospora thailandica]